MDTELGGKAKGKAKGKDKGKDKGASEHDVTFKSWERMSGNEQWYLYELWNGNLRSRVRSTEQAHGGQVQADCLFFGAERATG